MIKLRGRVRFKLRSLLLVTTIAGLSCWFGAWILGERLVLMSVDIDPSTTETLYHESVVLMRRHPKLLDVYVVQGSNELFYLSKAKDRAAVSRVVTQWVNAGEKTNLP